MAMKPADAAAAPMGADEEDPAAGADAGADTGADDAEEPGDEDVLLTVVKEKDGTYSLIKGDEEDADGADAAGSADMPGADASNKQSFDAPGPLLKAILDILAEDQSSAGADGSSEDQFQSGFKADSPEAPPAAPMAQKY